MRRAAFIVFTVSLFALAIFGAGTLGLQIGDRTPPIVYEDGKALADSVPQGGSISIQFQVFRTRICDGDAERWITDSDGVRHSIPSYTVSGSPPLLAGREVYVRRITIPDSIVLGPASYQVTLEFSCNWIHRLGYPIIVKSPPILFEITPRAAVILPPLVTMPDEGDG